MSSNKIGSEFVHSQLCLTLEEVCYLSFSWLLDFGLPFIHQNAPSLGFISFADMWAVCSNNNLPYYTRF